VPGDAAALALPRRGIAHAAGALSARADGTPQAGQGTGWSNSASGCRAEKPPQPSQR
jgi:hypothetical protein